MGMLQKLHAKKCWYDHKTPAISLDAEETKKKFP